MEFLDIPLYDDDVIKLLVRFLINGLFLALIVRGVYYKNSGSKDYIFGFCMINVLVFFICFTLKKFELQLGMALGLFAIFGILRYRTDPIPIREMTYLFMVIGVGVINALANKNMSYAEIGVTNGLIYGLAMFLEATPLLRHELEEKVRYEKIELIRPDRHDELMVDLEARTGLKISRIELGEIDFLRDTVRLRVFYYPHDQSLDGISSHIARANWRR
jgi:hypothetical protein